jgi:hypothetical protein
MRLRYSSAGQNQDAVYRNTMCALYVAVCGSASPQIGLNFEKVGKFTL